MDYVDFPPAVRFASWSAHIEPNTVGYEATLSRKAVFAETAGSRWKVTLGLAAMVNALAAEWRAFLHAMDGRANFTTLAVPNPLYTRHGQTYHNDETGFSDGTGYTDHLPLDGGTVASLALAQTKVLSLAGLPVNATYPAGTRLALREPESDDYQVVEIVKSASTTATGTVNVQVRPGLRKKAPAGTLVRVGHVPLKLRLADDTQADFRNAPFYTTGPEVQFVEAW